jgi:hypothetical protein
MSGARAILNCCSILGIAFATIVTEQQVCMVKKSSASIEEMNRARLGKGGHRKV